MMTRHRHQKRPGLAPLELVMAAPFLLIIAAVVFKVGEGFYKKAEVTAKARADSRIPRAAPRSPDPAPLPNRSRDIAGMGPDSSKYGLVVQPASGSVRLNPVMPGSQRLGGSYSVLYGTWDHKAVPFDNNRSNTNIFDWRAARMASVGAFSSLLPFDNLFNSSSGSQSSSGYQGLNSQLNNLRTKVGEASDKAREVNNNKNNPVEVLKQIFGAGAQIIDLITNPDKLSKALDAFEKINEGVRAIGKLVDKVAEYGRRQLPGDDF